MLFIAIGLIILFISFFAALVMLIRELGQRANIDDSLNDVSLDLADEVIGANSNTSDSPSLVQDEPINSLSPDSESRNPPSLDEVVPFPWETEAQSQLNDLIEQGEVQETEIVSNKLVSGRSRGNLNDQFSLSDLQTKTE